MLIFPHYIPSLFEAKMCNLLLFLKSLWQEQVCIDLTVADQRGGAMCADLTAAD